MQCSGSCAEDPSGEETLLVCFTVPQGLIYNMRVVSLLGSLSLKLT